jgi:hypothetical protein
LLEDFLDRIDDYGETRNYPAVKGPSYLSVHLRFGTVSIRQLVHLAAQRSVHGSAGAEVWLSELIWREFYFQILANFPHLLPQRLQAPNDAIVWEQGARRSSFLQPGVRVAPATRLWTRPWRRSIKPAICTTACAWWQPAFWSNTWALTGAGASAILRKS